MKAKKLLRARMKRRLASHPPRSAREKSLAAAKKLFQLERFRKASCVGFYVSLPAEVSTKRMIDRAIRMGKKVAVPRADHGKGKLRFYKIKSRRSLQKGRFGILEPKADKRSEVDPKTLDCVVVPGVAFDRRNYRMGRGKGFYDRFLKKLPSRVYKIGIAFSFQVMREVPREAHDVGMDVILTD